MNERDLRSMLPTVVLVAVVVGVVIALVNRALRLPPAVAGGVSGALVAVVVLALLRRRS
jgi:hypothetical protein